MRAEDGASSTQAIRLASSLIACLTEPESSKTGLAWSGLVLEDVEARATLWSVARFPVSSMECGYGPRRRIDMRSLTRVRPNSGIQQSAACSLQRTEYR